MWRSLIKGSASGRQNRTIRGGQGSVVTVRLGGFDARAKEQKCLQIPLWQGCPCLYPVIGRKPHEFTCATDCCVGIKERQTRDRVRERQYVAQLVETLVSPSCGGTESCEGATTSKSQGWQSTGLKRVITGKEESGNSVPQEPQAQLSVVLTGY